MPRPVFAKTCPIAVLLLTALPLLSLADSPFLRAGAGSTLNTGARRRAGCQCRRP